MAVAIIALHLVTGGMARAVAVAQLPANEDADKSDESKAGAPADGQPAEPEEPGVRSLEVTGFQCEALAMGKSIKELPPDTQIESMSFVDPPPVTFRLPEQRRESLTECTLRASGLTVRVDKSRNVITLLPSGTGSPELPNPKVKLMLKLSEEPAKPEK
ncbi:MAG: hypothetical protein HY060_06125 [Proteobacteria bacterium]|nr:hypothetical protein [Pseudomonadota bacterium]